MIGLTETFSFGLEASDI